MCYHFKSSFDTSRTGAFCVFLLFIGCVQYYNHTVVTSNDSCVRMYPLYSHSPILHHRKDGTKHAKTKNHQQVIEKNEKISYTYSASTLLLPMKPDLYSGDLREFWKSACVGRPTVTRTQGSVVPVLDVRDSLVVVGRTPWLTYPTLGKGKSSSKSAPLEWDMLHVSSLEGRHIINDHVYTI